MSHATREEPGPRVRLAGSEPAAGAAAPSMLRAVPGALRDTFRPYARYAVPVVAAALAAGLAGLTYAYECNFVTLEPDWRSIALVAATVPLLAALLCLATGRVVAAFGAACILLLVLTSVSIVKFHYLRSTLHALDFYYYARPTELVFLYGHYPRVFLAGCSVLTAALAGTWLLFVLDETRIGTARAALLLAVSALALAGAYQWRGERDKIYHFVGRYHVSAMTASLPEAVGVLLQGGLLRAADRGGRIDSSPAPHLQNAVAGQRKPTIIAVLHESSFPVGIYPQAQCGGPRPDALYRSSNGRRYDLRVETFGGATWLTEYGLMLGLSTYSFGDARSFIGYTMEGRVHDSLPRQMRRNGYETVALYPSPKTFVNTENFYRSLGFDRLLDYYDLDAPSEYERDRFYYGKTLDAIRAHKASGAGAPQFLFLWTMATHGPYDAVIHPDAPPEPASICGHDKAWAEYIRRLLISEADLAWFTERLKAEFPDEPFLLLGFGDHQPFIAQDFLKAAAASPPVPERNSIAYRTFFRITGVNFEPDWRVVPDSVDTPFLGNVMMLAARQPRHGFYNDRDKLMELCRGRYNDCPRQDEILSFHERLIRAAAIVN